MNVGIFKKAQEIDNCLALICRIHKKINTLVDVTNFLFSKICIKMVLFTLQNKNK
jgi:hypothetical protein